MKIKMSKTTVKYLSYVFVLVLVLGIVAFFVIPTMAVGIPSASHVLSVSDVDMRNSKDLPWDKEITMLLSIDGRGDIIEGSSDYEYATDEIEDDLDVNIDGTFKITSEVKKMQAIFSTNKFGSYTDYRVESVNFIIGTMLFDYSVRGDKCTYPVGDWQQPMNPILFRDYDSKCRDAGGIYLTCGDFGQGRHCLKLVPVSSTKMDVYSLNSPRYDWEIKFKYTNPRGATEELTLTDDNKVKVSSDKIVHMAWTGHFQTDRIFPAYGDKYLITGPGGESVISLRDSGWQYFISHKDDIDDVYLRGKSVTEFDAILDKYRGAFLGFVNMPKDEDYRYVEFRNYKVYMPIAGDKSTIIPTFLATLKADWVGITSPITEPYIYAVTDKITLMEAGDFYRLVVSVRNDGASGGISTNIICDDGVSVVPSSRQEAFSSDETKGLNFNLYGNIDSERKCTINSYSSVDPSVHSNPVTFYVNVLEECNIICTNPWVYHRDYPDTCECSCPLVCGHGMILDTTHCVCVNVEPECGNGVCEWGEDITCPQDCGVKDDCSSDADCKNGYECIENKCIEITGCSSDADCLNGYECIESKCVQMLLCNSDADCKEGFVCIDNECIESKGEEIDPILLIIIVLGVAGVLYYAIKKGNIGVGGSGYSILKPTHRKYSKKIKR